MLNSPPLSLQAKCDTPLCQSANTPEKQQVAQCQSRLHGAQVEVVLGEEHNVFAHKGSRRGAG